MVHAIKLTWKLGFGLLNERQSGKLHALVEAGYVIGSLLFTIGCVFFFPVDWIEDYVIGCRFFEIGSVVFAVLTLYTELDRYIARHQKEETQRVVTKRELLEAFLYCMGSFIFLVGTFLFDPPFVESLSSAFNAPKSHIENTAAILFMLGSFMFAFGSYVNALCIFEAPRMFRTLLLHVTTFYMFGGLLFIAGTMGYVEAFEPNLVQKWVSTWFYLIGCLFYVAGSFGSFVSTVARQQVHWERLQAREWRKQRKLARLLGKARSAVPGALKAVTGKRRPKAKETDHTRFEDEEEEEDGDGDFHLEDLGDAEDLEMDVDVEEAVERLAGEFAHGEEDAFAAFWRAMSSAGASPGTPSGVRPTTPAGSHQMTSSGSRPAQSPGNLSAAPAFPAAPPAATTTTEACKEDLDMASTGGSA